MTNLESQSQQNPLFLEKKVSEKPKYIILSIIIKIPAILIPLFLLVVPTTIKSNSIMKMYEYPFSMPLFMYLFTLNPSLLLTDFYYFFISFGFVLIIFGIFFFGISLIFQVINRNQLIKKGPYKYLKHPQFLAICFITLGFTLKSYYSEITFFPTWNSFHDILNIPNSISDSTIITMLWIFQVFLYVVLAQIENYSSRKRLGIYYLEYVEDIKLNWKFSFGFYRRYFKYILLVLFIFTCIFMDSIMVAFNHFRFFFF